MTLESTDDLAGLSRAAAAIAEARDAMLAAAQPGVSTLELDALAREILARHGARSAPQAAYDFPGSTCISINDEAAHGIPSARRLCAGDLVNVDVSAELDGYWADTGASTAVGGTQAAPPRARALLQATRTALTEALREARAGRPLNNLARAVQRRARRHGFRVVENICGHGVGRFIHEAPQVSNTVDPGSRTKLWEGLVIAVEPFLTTGARRVVEAGDGWTLRTPDGSLCAQFEHTVVITQGQPLILT